MEIPLLDREAVFDERKYICGIERLFPLKGNTFVGVERLFPMKGNTFMV